MVVVVVVVVVAVVVVAAAIVFNSSTNIPCVTGDLILLTISWLSFKFSKEYAALGLYNVPKRSPPVTNT